MIDTPSDQKHAAKRLLGSPRKQLLLGTALAVIAGGTLISGEAILTSPAARAAAIETPAQAMPAPD